MQSQSLWAMALLIAFPKGHSKTRHASVGSASLSLAEGVLKAAEPALMSQYAKTMKP